jgi:hypothetical protein
VDFLVLSASLFTAIERVSGCLQPFDVTWLLGGSCGLILHQVDIESCPRDLDIYMDIDAIDPVFRALSSLAAAVNKPHFSKTDIYESTLSHYQIEGVQVEAVGSFHVSALGSKYKVEAAYIDKHYRTEVQIGKEAISLMPLAHELLFNILRKRPDRYVAIAKAMHDHKEAHLPALFDLLRRNQWNDGVIKRVEELLQTSLQGNY